MATRTSDRFVSKEGWLHILWQLRPSEYRLQPRTAGGGGAQPAHILWVEQPLTVGPDSLEDICEALSLLEIIRVAQPELWRYTVDRSFFKDRSSLLPTSSSLPVPVVVGLHVKEVDTLAALEVIKTLLLSPRPSCAAFVELANDMLPLAPQENKRDHLSILLRISMHPHWIYGRNYDAPADFLKHARDTAQAQMNRSETDTAWAPRFRLEEVQFVARAVSGLTYKSLQQMCGIQDLGVRPPQLSSLSMDENAALDVAIVQAKCLRKLLALDGCSTGTGVDTVEVTYQICKFMPRLVSSIQHSASVRTVDIRNGGYGYVPFILEEPDGIKTWQWIAFALFSEYATHCIEELRVMFGETFPRSYVEAARRILASADPITELVREAEPNAGAIATRRLYLQRPLNGVASGLFETPEPVETPVVRSPQNGEDMWTVWLRGWSRAYVYPDDVLAQRPRLVKRESKPTFPFISVMRESRVSRHNEIALLGLVTHGTRHLRIRNVQDEPLDRWLGQLVTMCPALEDLQLEGACTHGLLVFVDSTVAGHTRLKRLSSDSIRVNEPERVTSFFEALEDPEHPLTVHLKEIHLTFVCRTYRDMNPILRSALSMLHMNDTLCVVKLRCYVGRGAFTAFENFKGTQFDNHTRLPKIVRTAPLALRSKLAFLSVVTCVSFTEGMRLTGGLDSNVLAHVFKFAAEGRPRVVQVTCKGPGASVRYNLDPDGSSDEDWEPEDDSGGFLWGSEISDDE